MTSKGCKIQEIRLDFFMVSKSYNLGLILSKFHGSQTYMTTGTEQSEKTLKSSELQSGSQQQLTSHCAGDRSQTHKAATTEKREWMQSVTISR